MYSSSSVVGEQSYWEGDNFFFFNKRLEIGGFFVGRKNQKLIDTITGAKANGLKLYDYFKYLFEEIPIHMEDKTYPS
ncbi:transposase domain-containing protein [Vallitalea longa]|uniref:transposase domain-containing protein n=1 Tax=Vallitalea longa TaxID=2936439 RepID=UPI0024934572|nr:transposase domain-containing protein [Vallitalea longa]